MPWKNYDPQNPPKPGTRVKGSLTGETIALDGSALCKGTATLGWQVWEDDPNTVITVPCPRRASSPDTLRSPEIKPKSNICACQIWRQDCEYHRD